jgi:mannose-1-phosphate guanylyltransferase
VASFNWNTGLFLSNVSFLHDKFAKILASHVAPSQCLKQSATAAEEEDYMLEMFPSCPNMSIEWAS